MKADIKKLKVLIDNNKKAAELVKLQSVDGMLDIKHVLVRCESINEVAHYLVGVEYKELVPLLLDILSHLKPFSGSEEHFFSNVMSFIELSAQIRMNDASFKDMEQIVDETEYKFYSESDDSDEEKVFSILSRAVACQRNKHMILSVIWDTVDFMMFKDKKIDEKLLSALSIEIGYNVYKGEEESDMKTIAEKLAEMDNIIEMENEAEYRAVSFDDDLENGCSIYEFIDDSTLTIRGTDFETN